MTEKQIEIFDDAIDKDAQENELLYKMRDALGEMYLLVMMPQDFSERDELEILDLTREAISEFTKQHG